jgi:hypothetical protein
MAKIIEFYIPQSIRKVSSGCRLTNAASCWSSQWRYDNPHDVARGNPMAKTHRAGLRRAEISSLRHR